jgi:hypothetical protein
VALTNLQDTNSRQRIGQEKPLAKLADINLFIRNRLLKDFNLLFGSTHKSYHTSLPTFYSYEILANLRT